MSISFNSISADIRTPGQYFEIDNSRAVQGVPAQPNVALIMGQRLTAGTVAEAVLTIVNSADDGDQKWGIGSQLAEMCRAFKGANPEIELWGIALDDAGGGTDATFTCTFAGSATEDGEVALYIAGRRVALAVASGDAAASVSVAMDVAILAATEYTRMPFTSGEAASVVTLTAKNAGTVANGLDVRHSYQPSEKMPAGLTLTIAAGVTAATDPTLSTAIAAMADTQYNTIVIPYSDATSLTAMEAEMTTRWGPMEQKEGQVFVGAVGTQSTLTSLGNTRNTQFVTFISGGGQVAGSPTPLYNAGAIGAAVDAAEPDPARPRTTLAMTGMLAPEPTDRFTRTERQTLLSDGVSTNLVDGGGIVRVERTITTYQTNPLSAPDPSYSDITTMRTLSRLRYDVRTMLALKFPRHKLADDGTLFDPGQAIATPSSIRSAVIALFRSWMTQYGLTEGIDQFKTDLIVERNGSDVNRIDIRMSPDLMNQLLVVAGQIQFLL